MDNSLTKQRKLSQFFPLLVVFLFPLFVGCITYAPLTKTEREKIQSLHLSFPELGSLVVLLYIEDPTEGKERVLWHRPLKQKKVQNNLISLTKRGLAKLFPKGNLANTSDEKSPLHIAWTITSLYRSSEQARLIYRVREQEYAAREVLLYPTPLFLDLTVRRLDRKGSSYAFRGRYRLTRVEAERIAFPWTEPKDKREDKVRFTAFAVRIGEELLGRIRIGVLALLEEWEASPQE